MAEVTKVDTSYAGKLIADKLKEHQERKAFCDSHILSLVPAFAKNILNHMGKNQKSTLINITIAPRSRQ